LKILFHNLYDSLNKENFLFNEVNTSIGDNLLAPFHELSRQAHLKNILVGTSDVIGLAEAGAFVGAGWSGDEPGPNLAFNSSSKSIACPTVSAG
jgi:hypothetical protein